MIAEQATHDDSATQLMLHTVVSLVLVKWTAFESIFTELAGEYIPDMQGAFLP